MTVPHWASELAGAKLSGKVLRELQLLQAHLLTFFLIYDPVLDGDARARTNPGEMLPLLLELHCGLSSFFDAGDAFWLDYRRLVRQQFESSRWEIAGRGRPAPRFDAALIRSLGLKLSLLRWPAYAVARIAGRPDMAALMDRIFDRFYRVLQLLDDVTDLETDRAKGQINAVVAAMAALPRRVSPDLAVAIGTARACAAARVELRKIRRELRGPAGRFALACEYLDDCCRKSEQKASVLAGHLVAKDVCDHAISALA
ncbi:MAG TPA: hypothetical protein VN874_09960 [Myxococcales bacterium]|nr:hypothetical protein [Myxococcales bacterium]